MIWYKALKTWQKKFLYRKLYKFDLTALKMIFKNQYFSKMNLAHKPAFLWRNVADFAKVQERHLYVTQASFSFFNHEKKYRTWKDYQQQNDFMIKLCLVTKKYVHTIQFFKMQKQYLATVKTIHFKGKKGSDVIVHWWLGTDIIYI